MSTVINVDLETMIEKGNLPSAIDFQYYNGIKNGVVILNEDIEDEVIEYVVMPLKELDADPDIDHVTLYVNSDGGDPYDGMAIVSTLENMTTPVTVYILGRAASAAVFIAMAKGDHIHTVCTPYSVGLIHQGSVHLTGNANAAEDTHDFLRKYEDKVLRKFVLSHTNISEEKYDDIKRLEFWMTADDMLKYGIVDEIV